MGSDFFQEDDDFRDNPVELSDGKWQEVAVDAPVRQPAQRPQQPLPKAPVKLAQEDEEFLESVLADEDEEDDYTVVLSDARLRLEQGKLYELIMNSDLFQDMDADPRAVRNVQREIKRFARERMEVMLGMRQEKQELAVASQFNSLEVDILKKLASKASGGATELPEAEKATWDNPPPMKKKTLTPISKPKQEAPKPAQKLLAKPQTPVARKAPQQAVAAKEEEYKPLDKDPTKMTTDELLQRNREAAERQAKQGRAKSSDSKPQPSYEQQEMMYAERMANTNVSIGSTPTPVSAIMAAINNSKK